MASPPSPASSAASDGDAPDHRPTMNPSDPPSLEDLIQHFVAAKRSLNTQTELWRAGEIVNAARGLLEENAILAAKNASIRNIVDEQVDALEAIRRGIDVVDAEVHAEFQQLLHDLDVSFTGLNSTLDVLRDTPIEAVLQPAGTSQKHLYDFIDSTTITNLKDALHACIDRYNESRSTLNDTSDAFDTALENLYSSIENVPMTPATTSHPSPIPRLYQELEGHAKEAAQCFQSLVRHYDLCVSALRHTEGGAAAATQATGDAPLSSAEDLYAAPEPMTEEERREMISVLQKDALEVEDVVTEIRERKSEMEFLLNHIQAHINHLRNEDSALHSILRMIAHVASEAKGHIITSRSFQTSYMEDTRPTLLNGIEEWENQREFYERFDLAYAELLVEISARRRRHEKAKRKAEDAQRELDRLHAEDERAREQFTLTQGDFLPLDIWPGLRDPPRKYAVRAVVIPQDEQGEEDLDAVPEVTDGGVQSIPQLGRNVVERALTRVKRRM